MLFIISGMILVLKRDYDFWQIPATGSIFEDLQTLTFNVICDSKESNWNPVINGCDPFSRPMNYPPFWLSLFRFFKFDESKTFFLGPQNSLKNMFLGDPKAASKTCFWTPIFWGPQNSAIGTPKTLFLFFWNPNRFLVATKNSLLEPCKAP
jgi:hypothetical protein